MMRHILACSQIFQEEPTNLADWHASAVESVTDFVLVSLAFC